MVALRKRTFKGNLANSTFLFSGLSVLQLLRSHAILFLLYLLVLLSGASLEAQAQTPHYTLAKAIGTSALPGDMRSEAQRSVVDAAGNIYVVGQFVGTVQFGSFTLTSVSGAHDVFVAKLDSAGTYQWVAQGGGLADDKGNGIGLDAAGNVYVATTVSTGSTNVHFGSIALSSKYALENDIVVAKLSSAGTWLWAVGGGGSGGAGGIKAAAIAVDATGNCYVTGSFDCTNVTFGTTTYVNPFYHGIACILKLDAAGNWLWAVVGGGTSGGSTESYDIALDDGGNAYITGYFEGPAVNFGPIQVVSGTVYPAVFVAKLSPQGQYQWVVPGGGGLYDYGQGIAVDKQRNVYVTGSFNSPTAPFGPFTLSNIHTALNEPYSDLFVAKLNTGGQYQWAVRGGGLYDDKGRSIRVDAQGNLLLTGYHNSPTIGLGSITLANKNVSRPGPFGFYDTYIAQLTAAGQFVWGVPGGGNATDFSFDLAIGGPRNSPHITGYSTTAPAQFGPFTLPTNPSGYTGFIARLSPPPLTVQVQGDSLLCQNGQITLRATASAAVLAYRWNTGATTPTLTVNHPGTYSVTVSFSTGQTATASFRVTTLTGTLAIGGDTLLCPGASGQLRAVASAGGATYQWSTGSQASSLAITQAGIYTLTATYGSGCALTTQVRVRVPTVRIMGYPQICPGPGGTAQLTAVAPGAMAYRWNTGATTAQLTVTQAGTYTVTAIFANGCSLMATQVVNAPEIGIQGDSLLCAGRTVQLSATNPAATAYAWNTGATTPAIAITQPGTYSVIISFGSGCSATARYQVRAEVPNPPFTLGADTTLCEGDRLVLRAALAAGGSGVGYQWSDGSTGSELVVQQAGTYRLQRTTRCETQTATRQISIRSCLFIPNIITPNNDGDNDVFLIRGLPPGDWSLEVFSRWGRQVYQTEVYRADWGSQAAPGLYYYLLRQPATGRSYKGWIEVVR
jgi:hypothetical protein